jgi:hypothetical protein
MTRDEILNMPASREMDALVAEKVMEFGVMRWINHPTYDPKIITPVEMELPHYSTDISAAWQVLEQLRDPSESEPDFWSITDAGIEQGWIVENIWAHHDGDIPNFAVQAETAPLAICRAALLAVLEKQHG